MKKIYNADVKRSELTKEDIENFLQESVVKFIFFDKKYAEISSDTTINEIHKFKSKYRANTYIIVPIKVIKGEDDKYASGIGVDDSDNPTAFAVVSKHDLRDLTPQMKKINAKERALCGKDLCKEYIAKYNDLLENNTLSLTITNDKGKVVYKDKIKGTFEAVNDYISHKIEEIQKTEII